MNLDLREAAESLVRILWLSAVLYLFAQKFDQTEVMTLGLVGICEGVLAYWRNQ